MRVCGKSFTLGDLSVNYFPITALSVLCYSLRELFAMHLSEIALQSNVRCCNYSPWFTLFDPITGEVDGGGHSPRGTLHFISGFPQLF